MYCKSQSSPLSNILSFVSDVNEWNVSDVSAWLGELQLQQYVSAFAQNAISGSVLVDITAEDLDYMDIKALGHRKVILKSVEDMRRTGSYTPGTIGSPQKMPDILRTVSNPNMGEGSSERSMMSLSMQVSGTKKSPTEVKTTHWSNLEPIANNKVRCVFFPADLVAKIVYGIGFSHTRRSATRAAARSTSPTTNPEGRSTKPLSAQPSPKLWPSGVARTQRPLQQARRSHSSLSASTSRGPANPLRRLPPAPAQGQAPPLERNREA